MIVNSLSEDDLSETDTFAESEPVVGILADNVLLSRFVLDSDETAFAEIVRRHGSLVMAVCRRVVGQAADADDAFQATFLALAHRPRSVRQCRSLTGSMYHYQAMTPLDRLLETVESMSGTAIQWFDIDGEGGRISAMQNSIIVLQTRRGHKAVVDTLEQLEQMASTADQ